jgi:hypothetical protein
MAAVLASVDRTTNPHSRRAQEPCCAGHTCGLGSSRLSEAAARTTQSGWTEPEFVS